MVALLKMPSNRISAVHGQDDRRVFPRKEVHAIADTTRMDNSLDALRFPRMTLHLRDVSAGGLSAISPTPLQKGERLSIYLPVNGNSGGWDAMGRVLRCEPSTMGYRVAMEFDPMMAA